MAKINTKNLNRFLLFKLPSAYISGIRVNSISGEKATASVKHRWINQNPFKSLYWATQGMAAELVTGVLMIKKIEESGSKIAMLVVKQEGNFHKKATGRIIFSCDEGTAIDKVIDTAIKSKEGQNITLKATGVDQDNDTVSSFEFTWSIKLRSKQ